MPPHSKSEKIESVRCPPPRSVGSAPTAIARRRSASACARCGARMIVIEVFAGGCKPRWPQRRAGSTRHEPDRLLASPLSRSDALAQPWRWYLSIQSHPSMRHSPIDTLPALAEMPTALSQPPVRADMHGASCRSPRPQSTSALTSNPHSARCQPVPNFPRLRALALFGRRPPRCADRPSSRRPKTCTQADTRTFANGEHAVELAKRNHRPPPLSGR